MSELLEGTTLNNRYKIHEKIGEGGMSFVYRAEDLTTQRIVAVKVLKKEFSYDDEFIKRFRNEAAAAQKLSHPNIVSIYDLKNDDDIQYIVMEYIDGITLDKLIRAKKKLPWKNTLQITAQILSAVEHAHSHNIIHRDIKPLNIMITGDGIVKLTDFGIARAVSSATKTAANDSAGSVHYLSPEQVRGGFVDERTDIYSIGITMYEMVTGSVPYDGDSHVSIALKHIDGKIKPPCEVDPTVPHGVSDLIVLATRKETNKRFQSAGEMHEQLIKVAKNPYMSFLSGYESTPDEEKENINVTDDADEIEVLSSESADIIRRESINDEKNKMAARVVFQTVTYLAAVIASVLVLIFIVSRNNIIKKNFKNYNIIQYKIEDYRGMQASAVIDAMAGTGIKIEQDAVLNEMYPAGYILSQSVEPGKMLQESDVLRLSVSAREGSIILEDYAGESFQVVGAKLMTQGVRVVYKEMHSSKYEDGKIIRTSPGPGGIVEKNDEVIIYYSIGDLYRTTTVPNLVGMTLEEARRELSKSNISLNVGLIYPSPSALVDDLIVTPAPATQTEMPSGQTPGGSEASPTPPMPTPSYGDITNTDQYNDTASPGMSTPDIDENTGVPTDSGAYTDVPGSPWENTPDISEPTATPSPTHIYASDRVVSQYPAPGTEVMVNEKVNLYFYDVSKITPRKKLYMNFPIEAVTGTSCYVRIEAIMTDSSNPAEIVYMNPSAAFESFPIEYEVPVSLNGAPTKVYIYIAEQGGTPSFYKVLRVYG